MNEIINMINNINNIGDYQLYDLPGNRQLYVNQGVVKIIEYDRNSEGYLLGLQDNIITTHSAQEAMYSQMITDEIWFPDAETTLPQFKWNTPQSINMDIRGFFMLGYRNYDYGFMILDYDGMYQIVPIINKDDYEALVPYQNDFVGIVPNVKNNEGLEAMIRAKIEIYRSRLNE